jgi:hypothetical protein
VWFDPNQGVTTDGSGNVITWSARIGTGTALIVDGKTSLDTGAITTDGSGKVTAAKLNLYSLPTSSSGLSSGDVWNDSGTLKIV